MTLECTANSRGTPAAVAVSSDSRGRTVVVVVNYRTPELVMALLSSLQQLRHPPMGVMVLDNASGDGSLAALRQYVAHHALEAWICLQAASVNAGFAGGNNAAIRCARLQWPDAAQWLLLNPDTVVCENAIQALEHHLLHHLRAGIAGSQIQDARGQVEASGHIGDGPLAQCAGIANLGFVDQALRSRFSRLTSRTVPTRCDWVSGAALMIRASVLDRVGMLDDGFFLYFEEADLCRRVRRAGWQVWLVPSSTVIHFEGSSTGIGQGRRPAYWFASRRRYFRKHFGVFGCLAADTAWCLGRGLHIATRLLLGRRPNPLPPRFALDLLLGDIRALWSKPTARGTARD